MAKQKIVVKVTMNCEKEYRKALTIAAGLSGVYSVSFVGSDKDPDRIAVTGEGIDSFELVKLLRKRVGHTEILSLGTVEEKKAKTKETKPSTSKQIDGYGKGVGGYGK